MTKNEFTSCVIKLSLSLSQLSRVRKTNGKCSVKIAIGMHDQSKKFKARRRNMWLSPGEMESIKFELCASHVSSLYILSRISFLGSNAI